MDDLQLLWKGVQLCIALQLTIIGFLNFFYKRESKIILGFICIIVASYFYKTIFWQQIDTNILFTLFFSGALFCFYGQLLYAYLVIIEEKITVQFLATHFTFPLIIGTSYSIIRVFFYDVFNNYVISINIILLMLSTFWIGFYFYLGLKKFKQSLNDSLVFKAKRKYKIFYYAINIFLLNQFISALIIMTAKTTNNWFIDAIDKCYFSYFSEYLNLPFYIVLSLYLLLYTLSQSKSFKSFFLNEQQLINKEIIDGKEIIKQRIQTFFYDEKIYTNPNLKIKEAASKMGVSDKILSEYLANEVDTNFKDFINTLRINEFKSLLQDQNSKQYSLVGLAEKAGFKSKATFYRVFKNKEQITPNEYLKSL